MRLSRKYLILGGALIVMFVLVYFLGRDRQSYSVIKKNFESSKLDSLTIRKAVNPAGTFLLFNLLKNYKNTASIQKVQTSQSTSLSNLSSLHPPSPMSLILSECNCFSTRASLML